MQYDEVPLHYSAYHGHLSVCEYLIEKGGADVNAKVREHEKE